jgi:hypothetical protein
MNKTIVTASVLAIFLMSVPNAYAACPCKDGYEMQEKTSTFSWNIFKGFKKCEPCTKQKCVKTKCPKQAKAKCDKCSNMKDKCNKCAKEPKCPKAPKCTGAAAPATPEDKAPCNDCTKAF